MAKSFDELVKRTTTKRTRSRAAARTSHLLATTPSGKKQIVRKKKPVKRMPEGEVVLRLAFHLLKLPGASRSVTASLDRHHVKSGDKWVFRIATFLAAAGWKLMEPSGGQPWLGIYAKGGYRLTITGKSIGGDIVAVVRNRRIRVECKKGKLGASAGNPENKLIHEAIGQIMTIEECADDDVLIVAVPRTDHHRRKLAWQHRPLMQRCGIYIVLVGADGVVEGMPKL